MGQQERDYLLTEAEVGETDPVEAYIEASLYRHQLNHDVTDAEVQLFKETLHKAAELIDPEAGSVLVDIPVIPTGLKYNHFVGEMEWERPSDEAYEIDSDIDRPIVVSAATKHVHERILEPTRDNDHPIHVSHHNRIAPATTMHYLTPHKGEKRISLKGMNPITTMDNDLNQPPYFKTSNGVRVSNPWLGLIVPKFAHDYYITHELPSVAAAHIDFASEVRGLALAYRKRTNPNQTVV